MAFIRSLFGAGLRASALGSAVPYSLSECELPHSTSLTHEEVRSLRAEL